MPHADLHPPRPPHAPLVAPGQVVCHAADLTATFAADVSLGQVQRALAEHRQWLPIDGDPDAPVGRLVETDSTGPLRLGYGAWRDLLLGVQFLNGRDELITAGGRTVKNVAGYDLTKLMVGQRGVFGRLVTLTVRTYRQPAGALLARWTHGRSVQDRVSFLVSLLATDLRPQWALLHDEALLCGYLGDDAALGYYASELPRHPFERLTPATLDDDIRQRLALLTSPLAGTRGAPPARLSLPPARLGEFLAAAGLERWIADPAFGRVWCAMGAPAALADTVHRFGGSAVIQTPDGAIFDPSLPLAVRLLVERLKAAFDPDNRLPPLPWARTAS